MREGEKRGLDGVWWSLPCTVSACLSVSLSVLYALMRGFSFLNPLVVRAGI